MASRQRIARELKDRHFGLGSRACEHSVGLLLSILTISVFSTFTVFAALEDGAYLEFEDASCGQDEGHHEGSEDRHVDAEQEER